ncbi:MAG: transglutaminase, partial [Deltaproteobacteria bacterium]|nr:transglutaminase [Deltaproteobacteria bacterium]
MDFVDQTYLSPTSIINSDHQTVIEYANKIIKDTGSDPAAQAVKLYYAVR